MTRPTSRFVPVEAEIIERIRQWRNSDRVRSNMLDDTLISESQQLAWFRGLPLASDRHYRVFLQSGRPVGMLYFAEIADGECKWGCYLGEESVWPGSGLLLEIAALDYAFGILGVRQLVAEVFSDNPAPMRLHEVFGYRKVDERECRTKSGVQRTLVRFEYLQAEWLEARQEVLGRLPRAIQEAAALIQFA